MTHAWEPIRDLPEDWRALAHDHLRTLANVWGAQRQRLESTRSFQSFLEKMRRRIAIETGVIERLYSIDRGITQLLIERGIDAALIPHGATDKPAAQVVALIRDQESAVARVFDVVGAQRDLSTSFIKQLHQLLTKNQPTTTAVDMFGVIAEVELIRGDWKRMPNNPTRADGTIYEYCPPEQVSAQMDQLIDWHLRHRREGVSPEVEAAWLHHRFTQIHPFQDGNRRVARNLATLVFLRAGWFPLVIVNGHDENEARGRYIDALERADAGDLRPLVGLFADAQQRAFLQSLSLSEEVLTESASRKVVINAAADLLARQQQADFGIVQHHSEALFGIAVTNLAQVERDLFESFRTRALTNASVRTESARSDSPKAGYYKYQIAETAKALGYYANLVGHKSWVRLAIRVGEAQTELLISFHGLGYEPHGVMMCSACAYQRVYIDEAESPSIEQIEPLADPAFAFTYEDDLESLKRSFEKWLNDAVLTGLEYWRRRI
jgi:Fic family protein